MPIFKGIPPGKKIAFDDIGKQRSVMCRDCQSKFKEFIKNGGVCPKPCEVCKEKLKNKMYDGIYPDR